MNQTATIMPLGIYDMTPHVLVKGHAHDETCPYCARTFYSKIAKLSPSQSDGVLYCGPDCAWWAKNSRFLK